MANTSSRVLMTGTNQITQRYGNGHGGVDLVRQTNQLDSITAHSDGTVVWCQSGIPNDTGSSGNRSYGNAVKIRHANGYYTLYAHMDSIAVKNGQTVKAGQKIGYMGNTGNSYGAHLHFEVRNAADTRVNPEPYLNDDLPGNNADKVTGYTGDLTYRAYTGKAWQPKVINCSDGADGYAGIFGMPIEGLQIDAEHCDVFYRVHTLEDGWLPEVKNSGTGADGYAGIYGRTIDGIQIRTNQGYVDCRVHLVGDKDYLDWVRFGATYQDGPDGYAGIFGRAIDGVQMK